MQIRINGSANLSQVRAEFAALEAQVTGLNAAMAKGAATPVVNPKGYQTYTKAVQAGSDAFRNSLASSGAFRVEQMKLSSATDHYTDLLQKQKLSFREVFGSKNKALMHSIYQEQLNMDKMRVRHAGGNFWDVYSPKGLSSDIGTLTQRLNFLGAELKSAGTHMVNFGKNTQWAGRQLTVGFTMPIVALGAAAAVMAYKVDQQMTRVRKVYDTTADQSSTKLSDMMAVQNEFTKLNEDSWKTVTKATKEYASSATDTLGVQADLAAAGYKGQKLQKSTVEVMKSAMLGEIDYQTATTATIALQQQLHLSTVQLSDSWAYMNSVENSTSLQMKDFASAIPIALGPIRQMGGDLQDLGTLMTAMISRGVQVGKAANAIKALPQRLSRPSKQVQAEFKAITGQDIVELNKKNPNNIIGLLTDIEHAVEGLSTLDKRKALAGLFGTYQLSTMSSMLDGMKDLENQTGQTYKAFQIGEQTTKEWRQISEQEIGQMQKSVSFRFKKMVNEVKNQAVEFGKPFLQVFTVIGNGLVQMLDTFNSMPKALKIMAAIPIALAAIAGPVLMLIGLTANLAGNFMKGAGSLLSWGKALVITTAEEKARIKVHQQEQAQMSMVSEQIAVQTRQLELLAAAENNATRASMEFMLLQQKSIPLSKISNTLGRAEAETAEVTAAALLKEAEALEAAAAAERRFNAAQTSRRTPAGTFAPNTPGYTRNMGDTKVIQNKEARAAELRAKAAAIESEQTAKTAVSTTVIASNTEKSGAGMMKGAAGAAAMGASMVLMMGPFGKLGATIGEILMISTFLTPALKAANIGVLAMAANVKKAGGLMALFRSGAGGAAAGVRGIGAAFMGMMGPVGWTVAAVTTIGVIAYKIWQHNKKITEEHNKQSNILSKQNTELNDQLSLRTKMMKLTPSGIGPAKGDGTSVPELADALYASKSGKDLINTYKDADEIEKATLAAQTYMDALNAVGGTADKARKKVEALMLAAGEGSIKAQTDARQLMQMLGPVVSPEEMAAQWGKQMAAALDETSKAAEKTGDTLGQRMADAIARGGPGAADNFLTAMQSQIDQQYKDVFTALPKDTADYFRSLGITSAKTFDEAMADYPGSTASQKALQAFADKYKINVDQVENFMQQVYAARGALAEPLNNIQSLEQGIAAQISSQLRLAKTAKDLDEIRASWAFKLLNINKQNAAATYLQYVNSQKILDPMGTLNGIVNGTADAQRLTLAQQAAQAAGLKVVNDLAEQERILTEAAKGNFIGANDEISKMPAGLSKANALLAASVSFTKDQLNEIKKNTMSGITEDVANGLQAGFDAQQKAAQDSLQTTWDKRLKINDRNAERESNRLERKWEMLHNKTDAKWDRRKDAMTAYWDKRIDNVDKAIEAEQKADDIRQKIFEAEKTRLERLAEMQNTSIDFNVALNSGQLDEAAKIANDARAKAADWALSDAAGSSEDASKKRQDTLNDQKDLLEKQKDAALKNLDTLEKANQESLDKREKQEKKHLDRMQKARQEDLQRQQENANRALANRQARESMAFDQRLTLFKSYIARDQADLERWMKEVGVSYDGFGKSVKDKGETWSAWFQASMVAHMRTASSQIASDNMWAEMGKAAKNDMFHAMGFKGIREFANFIRTGNLPADYGNRDLNKKKPTTTATAANGLGAYNPYKPTGPAYHVGGEVGVDAGGRNGVARSLKTLHPSETLINAQKGEFVINRRAAQENKPLLQAINDGKPLDSRSNIGYGVGGDVPVSGLAMGIASVMLAKGIASAMSQKVNEINAQNTVSSMNGAVYSALKSGKFGSRNFDAEQLGNAAIIAEVGSGMGLSNRDIEIGIMTAITESGLRNLKSGDRDSQGLFQQRPSQGWGSVEQVTNPRYAANAFFSHLKALADRGDMSPWMAAQNVQRSAFSDGSNYKQYWDEAVAIFSKGLTASGGGFTANGGLGGYQRASVPGKGWMNSHDYRNGLGSPLFAADDGRIIESRAITSGGSPGNGLYGNKYRSFGETIVLLTKDGDRIRYAHLNPNTRAHTGPVRGGALIGRSGMTGNATGPHTHFEINGQEIAREWFRAHGIGLDTGGYTTSDGMANLHKDEVVIDPNRTAALYNGLDTFSSLMDSVKNVGNGMGGDDTGSSTDFGASRIFGVGNQSEFTTVDTNLRDHPIPPPPTPTSAAASAKKSTTLRTGTFNMHAYGHSDAKSIADLKKILPHVDTIAFQEFTSGKVRKWMEKNGWGVYKGPTGTAIAWRNSAYTASNLGSYDLNKKYRMPAGTSQRYAVYGLMRNKKTGGKFWEGSVHLIPNEKYYKGRVSKRLRDNILAEQYARLRRLIDRLNDSAPVIMGGDYNDKAMNKLGKMHSSSPGGSIDQIYSGAKLKSTGDARAISNKVTNSDHAAWYANYTLPGLRTGGYTMSDGLAQLHENELVVDPARTKVLLEGIDNFASGSNANYNVHMTVNGDTNADEIVTKTITALKRMEARKPQSRRG